MASTLSASTERELERRAKHKLAVLRHVDEVSGNVAASSAITASVGRRITPG